MLVQFTLANIGPFKEPVSLSFEATKASDMDSSFIREIYLTGGKKPLRLLRLALIYGPNASGKTTVLEALSLLDQLVTAPFKDAEEQIDVNTFAFQNHNKHPSELTLEFVNHGLMFEYHVSLLRQGIVKERLQYKKSVSAKYSLIYERGADKSYIFAKGFELNSAQHETITTNLVPNLTILSILNRNMSVDSLGSPLIAHAYQWFKHQLLGEVAPQTSLTKWVTGQIKSEPIFKSKVVSLLNQAGLPISDVHIEEGDLPEELRQAVIEKLNLSPDRREELLKAMVPERVTTQYRVNRQKYSLPFDQESLGTKRYYGFAGLLAKLCPDEDTPTVNVAKVLPIDELEHSLHPELVEHFLKTFLKQGGDSQLIATTHYRELLNNRLLFRDDVIWFIEKDNESLASNLYSLSDIKGNNFRKTSSVYNFYKQGRLGSVPELES